MSIEHSLIDLDTGKVPTDAQPQTAEAPVNEAKKHKTFKQQVVELIDERAKFLEKKLSTLIKQRTEKDPALIDSIAQIQGLQANKLSVVEYKQDIVRRFQDVDNEPHLRKLAEV